MIFSSKIRRTTTFTFEDTAKDFLALFEIAKNKKEPEVVEESFYNNHRYWIVDFGSYKNAYVEINKNHPFYELARQGKYEDITIKTHGGLSFSGSKLLDVADNTAIIGWDYGHYFDVGKNIKIKSLKEDIKDVIKQLERVK